MSLVEILLHRARERAIVEQPAWKWSASACLFLSVSATLSAPNQ